MIELEATTTGVVLLVHAQPGARRNAIIGEHAGRLKVAVTEAPERGKANKALIELLADALGVKRSQVRLLSGDSGSRKKFLIVGGDLSGLNRRLGDILAP